MYALHSYSIFVRACIIGVGEFPASRNNPATRICGEFLRGYDVFFTVNLFNLAI